MKTKAKLLCELQGCKNRQCGKKILIEDFGPQGKWYANVCEDHYKKAHKSRK